MRREQARRWYRRLLRAYPRRFRERYGAEMESTFLRLLELRRGGWWSGVRLWVGGARDALAGGVRQRLKALSGGNGAGRSSLAGRARAERGRAMMHGVTQVLTDIRYAVRSLARQPVFTGAAVLTLALGIGANTAVFSVVNPLLIRPLPYPDSDRLVMAWSAFPERGWDDTDVAMVDAWEWRSEVGAFADLAVFDRASLNLTGGDRPERLAAIETTPNLMSVLGVEPALGRDLTEADNREGASGVVLLSHGFWQRRFGGDRDVLGRSITLDGRPHTVVGVMGPQFRFLEEQPDLWLPFGRDPAAAERGAHGNRALARLAPGATLERANRELARVAAAQAEAFPESNEGWIAYAVPLRRVLLGDVGFAASLLLMSAVGFVLLMACVNVANLLLARANARRREIAVRSALGAGRRRLLLQMLTESLVLAVAGGLLGTAFAVWAQRGLARGLPDNVPIVFEFGIDGRVFLFAAGLSLATTVLFGLAPALRASRTTGLELGEGGRGGRGRRASRFGSALIVVQTALATVLLVAGGVMMRSVGGMHGRDLGFEPEGVLTLRTVPPASKYQTAEEINAFFDRALDRIRALPSVRAAGTVQVLPLSGSNWVRTYRVPGVHEDEDDGITGRLSIVSPGYFDAIGTELIQGRTLRRSDRSDAPRVVLVNRTMAERLGPDPLGTQLAPNDDGDPWRVVGVVADIVERDFAAPVEPAVYYPRAQVAVRATALAIRTATPPTDMVASVRRAIADVDPEQPIFAVQPLRDLVAVRRGGYQFIAILMGGFAAISLLLGAVGIYGVTAYGVGRRTTEIGVRLAMGARRAGVTRMIVREGLLRAGIGLGIGLILAVGLTRAMSSLLVDTSPTDPPTFLGVAAILAAVAWLGSYLPARNAAKADPVQALAHE